MERTSFTSQSEQGISVMNTRKSIATRRIAVWMAATLSALVQLPALASDCEWSRQKLRGYEATCAQADGCRHKAMMASAVAKACGGTPDGSTLDPNEPGNDGGQGSPGSASSNPGDRSPSDKPPAIRDNYAGESCVFFTRPTWEREGGVTRRNKYANGAHVCFQGKLYECKDGRWSSPRNCPTSIDAWKYQAERIEGTARGN